MSCPELVDGDAEGASGDLKRQPEPRAVVLGEQETLSAESDVDGHAHRDGDQAKHVLKAGRQVDGITVARAASGSRRGPPHSLRRRIRPSQPRRHDASAARSGGNVPDIALPDVAGLSTRRSLTEDPALLAVLGCRAREGRRAPEALSCLHREIHSCPRRELGRLPAGYSVGERNAVVRIRTQIGMSLEVTERICQLGGPGKRVEGGTCLTENL